MKLRNLVARLFQSQVAGAGLVLGALATVLEKDAWEKLPKDVQSLYPLKDGKYTLDVEFEDNSGLKSALQAEREARRKAEKLAKETTEKFEGLDIEQVRTMLAQMDESEEGKLIKAGKIDEVLSRRNEKLLGAHKKQIDDMEKKYNGSLEVISSYMEAVIDNEIRAAAQKAGVHPHAIDDALYRGRQLFTVDDHRKVLKVDADGHPVLGKDGKTPYQPGEWIEEMKKDAPHWFPHGASGGGSNGAGRGTGSQSILKRAEFEAITDPTKRAAVAKEAREGKLVIQD